MKHRKGRDSISDLNAAAATLPVRAAAAAAAVVVAAAASPEPAAVPIHVDLNYDRRN